MTIPKGWKAVTATSVHPITTITDLVAVTGYSRRNVRDFLSRYGVKALPRYGPNDTLRYVRQDVIAAIAEMPGSGKPRKGQP